MKATSALIGYTGFVGSNLVKQYSFTKQYNSKNIMEIEGQDIDLVVCAGVSAVKWLANQEPQLDMANIEKLKNHISRANIKHLVLISTIDVYDSPQGVDEDTLPDFNKQDFYGKHRYQLEQWVAKQTSIAKFNIIRLPALFGNHLKKNLIFDILNPLAKSINKRLWEDLQPRLAANEIEQIRRYYNEDEFGNLKQNSILDVDMKNRLIGIFARAGFSALNFTDSRSSFQFYNLANLWQDIRKAIDANYCILNLSSEPVTARELVKHLTGKDFINHTAKGGISYDMYSKYAPDAKYLYAKTEILDQIKFFVEVNR